MKKKELYAQYLLTDAWKEKRLAAIARDGSRCKLCNSRKKLTVHHRKYPQVFGEEPLVDLVTLCDKCHMIFHQNVSVQGTRRLQPKKKKKKQKKQNAVAKHPQNIVEIDFSKPAGRNGNIHRKMTEQEREHIQHLRSIMNE